LKQSGELIASAIPLDSEVLQIGAPWQNRNPANALNFDVGAPDNRLTT
jgi:hypothetical protein